VTTFVILEPEEWGMRWERPPLPEKLLDPEVFVHHRAGNPHHDRDAAEVFREMNEGAISGKHYSATDYDVLVHENTITDTVTIGVARGVWLSAATKDRNEQGEAICALGYFHPGSKLSEHPSPGMVEGVARGIALMIRRGWAAPDAVILGHRQNPAHVAETSCPGDYLFAEMDTIRRRVAELLAPVVEQHPPVKDSDMNTPFIRFDGYADQFIAIPVTQDSKARLDPSDVQRRPIVVKTDLDRAELEAKVGYQLTPGI